MLASEALTLGAAIFGLLTSIAGSSACFYNSFRTNRINLSILKVRVHNLENLIDAVQQKLNGIDVLRPDPTPWINHAKEFLSRVNISDLERRLNGNCGNSRVPNLWHQCGAERSIEAKIRELDVILENGKRVSQEIKIKGSKQPEVPIFGNALEKVRKKIWEQVSQGGAVTLCVHGVAGVGKTALASIIHNRALVELNEFETVIWVSIEYGLGLRNIQEELASKLHVDLSSATDSVERSKMLRSVLMQKGKFLLVLDSPWHALSLHDIGIPEPIGGSKLIVTSRTYSLCRKITRKFYRKEIYEIKPLSEVEAWELFKGELGPNITLFEKETLHMAKHAVQDLDGLPLLVKMLVEFLSDVHDEDPIRLNAAWKEELMALSGSTSFLGNKSHELLDSFKYSYENLGEVAMSAFMYCALFPKGYLMSARNLIEYWMCEGLLGQMVSLDESARHGRRILNELKDAHLLGNVSEIGMEDSVKMLNIVRHVAINAIVKTGHHFVIHCGNKLSEQPLPNSWPVDTERASFMLNKISSLRNGPNCTKLSSLLLQYNPLNMLHNENFFSKIRGLKVLDLSNTDIKSLPRSLSGLTNLRALLLRGCKNLKCLPPLSTLQKLIVMDLAGTPLEKLPQGLPNLTNLRRLDLSQTMLDNFPAQIIGKLTLVEELLLITADHGGYVWGSKQISPQWPGACVEELVDLKMLVVLQLIFLNAKVFNNYIVEVDDKHSSLPRNFRFCVGGLYTAVDVDVGENSIAVIGDYNIRLPEKTSVLHLMFYSEKVTSLKFDGCIRDLTVLDVSNFDELTYLLSVGMLANLRSLKKICVKRCEKMKAIIQPDEERNPSSITLSGFRTLILFDLPALENICLGEVLNCPSLRSVEGWNCSKLKLPETLLGRNGGIVEIRGDKEWVEKVKVKTPSSKSTFKFSATSVPAELSSTPCFRVRRQESFVIENQTQPRSIFGFPEVSFTKIVSRERIPSGDKNAAVNVTSTLGRLFGVKGGVQSSHSANNLRITNNSDPEDSVRSV